MSCMSDQLTLLTAFYVNHQGASLGKELVSFEMISVLKTCIASR